MQLIFLSVLLFVGGCFTQSTITLQDEEPNQFKDLINSIADNEIDTATRRLHHVFSDAQEKIDKLVGKAKKSKVGNSLLCLSDNRHGLKDMLKQFIKEETNCVKKEVKHAMSIIDEGAQISTATWNSITHLPAKISDCKTKLVSMVCGGKVVFDLIKLHVGLPLKIIRKLVEVVKFVGGLQMRVGSCATFQVIKASMATGKVVADLAMCLFTARGR